MSARRSEVLTEAKAKPRSILRDVVLWVVDKNAEEGRPVTPHGLFAIVAAQSMLCKGPPLEVSTPRAHYGLLPSLLILCLMGGVAGKYDEEG